MEILIATGNAGKLREYQELLAELDVTLISLRDIDLHTLDVEETGTTFEANAIIKAEAYGKASGKLTIADDSGLCVAALDGGPGIYSARYAGADATDADRRAKLLQEIAGAEDRSAYFDCVIALYTPQDNTTQTTHGVCHGRIATQESDGQNGFGYDPLFIPDGYTATFADIDKVTKNQISHRGRAAQALVPLLM
jgi:non-canonical purine NTP pyrophosphatase (RdgB/HAM1 family)